MVISNDREVWERSVMFHDVGGGVRNEFPAHRMLWEANFRMPELLAAVALVQIGWLDGLLYAMRGRKRMLLAGISDVVDRKGIALQEVPDPEGDASVGLTFFLDSPTTAERVAEALQAENIGAGVGYHLDRADLHIYSPWLPIMEQRTWTDRGGLWRWAQRDIRYDRNACPRTLDLLGRAVHLNVSPLLTNQGVQEVIDGVWLVLDRLTLLVHNLPAVPHTDRRL